MSKQVLSVEQMKCLQRLGLDTSGSSAFWCNPDRHGDWFVEFTESNGGKIPESNKHDEFVPAYTLQDVLDALPRFVTYQYRSYDLIINMEQFTMEYFREADLYTLVKVEFINTSLIDAAYDMLCWCIKEGYVKTNN